MCSLLLSFFLYIHITSTLYSHFPLFKMIQAQNSTCTFNISRTVNKNIHTLETVHFKQSTCILIHILENALTLSFTLSCYIIMFFLFVFTSDMELCTLKIVFVFNSILKTLACIYFAILQKRCQFNFTWPYTGEMA